MKSHFFGALNIKVKLRYSPSPELENDDGTKNKSSEMLRGVLAIINYKVGTKLQRLNCLLKHSH
jgi:hypothetical protein